MGKGVCGRLKMDVPGLGSGNISTSMEKRGWGVLNIGQFLWLFLVRRTLLLSVLITHVINFLFNDVIFLYFSVSFYSIGFITNGWRRG